METLYNLGAAVIVLFNLVGGSTLAAAAEEEVHVQLMNRRHVRSLFGPPEYHVQIRTLGPWQLLHDMKLKPVGRSTFGAGFQYTEIGEEEGRPIVRRWIPARKELDAIDAKMYTTPAGRAFVRVEKEDGHVYLDGVVNGARIRSRRAAKAHVLGKALPPSHVEDFVVVPWTPSLAPELRHGAAALPVHIEPELALVLDHSTALAIGGDRAKKLEYAAITVNGINGFYEQTNDSLTIKCELVNVVEIQSEAQQPFITNLTSLDKWVGVAGEIRYEWENRELLDEFSKWTFTSDAILGKYDVAALVVGLQLDPTLLGGVAVLAGACRRDPPDSVAVAGSKEGGRDQAVVLGMDAGASFLAVGILVHEIAHSLGAPHDGGLGGRGEAKAEYDGVPDTSGCPFEDGYLMSYKRDVGAHAFRLSNCSIAAMKAYITSGVAGCLAPSNKTRQAEIHSTRIEPGDGGNWNPDRICGSIELYSRLGVKGVAKHQAPDQQCRLLICEALDTEFARTTTVTLQPPRNAPCGDPARRGKCKNGFCVAPGEVLHPKAGQAGGSTSLRDICVDMTGEVDSKPMAPAGGDRNLLCAQLECVKPDGGRVRHAVETPDGTICGPLRRCRDGKCVICGQ